MLSQFIAHSIPRSLLHVLVAFSLLAAALSASPAEGDTGPLALASVDGRAELVVVDTDGATTSLGSSETAADNSPGIEAYDRAGRRFFYVTRAGDLVTLEPGGGSTIVTPEKTLIALEHDGLGGKLRAVADLDGEAWIAELDPASGELAKLVATGLETADLAPGIEAFDAIGGRFFLLRGESEIISLTLDGESSAHALEGQVLLLEYDSLEKRLLAIIDQGGAAELAVADLDEGTLEPLAETGLEAGRVVTGVEALDPFNRQFSFLLEGGLMATVPLDGDETTLAIVDRPLLLLDAGELELTAAMGDIPYDGGELICGPSESEWVDRFNCPMTADRSEAVTKQTSKQLKAINCNGFILEFEDVLNSTGTGFADQTWGTIRQNTACQVFIDLAAIINLGGTTPDILIREAEFDGQGPLASASPTIPGTASGCIAGSLHEHITTGIDPTPTAGVYDAEIHQVDFGARTIGATTLNVHDDWTTVPVSDIDLYSVILHEAMHALGFFSLIGPSGASVLTGGAYSLYDEFLVDNGNLSNKLVSATCNFQGLASDLISNQVLYNTPATHNSVPQPVYSPPVFKGGSSLSHFDDVRALMRYVMRPSTSGGADRQLTQPELDVLCDLGYNLFGTTCTNHYPVGVDDTNLNNNVTNPGTQICIDVLANDSDPDNDPLSIDPGSVLITNGGGTTTISGSDICYTPSQGFCGIATINYQPSDGQRSGNVTQLLVDVQCQVCPNDPCNLVCNGGFEDGLAATAPLSFTLFWPGPTAWPVPPCSSPTAGWCGQRDSPDYFIRNSVTPNWGIPNNFFGTANTHNTPNDRYVGMMRTPLNGGNYEGVFTQTIQPLDGTGATTYEFDFWAFAVNNGCTSCIDGELEVYLDDVPPLAGTNPSLNALSLGTFTVPRTGWTQFSVPAFTTAFNYEFLVIRALDPAPTGSNTYIYVDDVAIREVSAVNVDILKWVNDPTPELGQAITYTIAVCNLDTSPIFNVTIQDVLPPGLTYAGTAFNAYPQHIFPSIAGQTCNVVDLDATVDVTAPVNVPITNCAHLASAGSFCSSLGTGSNCADIIIEATDIGVTKTVSNTNPAPWSTVAYTVTVTNFGPSDATGVVVNDLLPSGVSYVGHSSTGGTTYNNGNGDFVIPSLTAGSSVTLTIFAQVGATGCGVVNFATLTAIDQTDLDSSNNQATASFVPCIVSGSGSGVFVDSGQLLGNEASITLDLGDIDNDGDLDAVVGNFRQPARVWINTGFGIYTAGQAINTWEDVAVRLGHFNNDGNLDLFVADNTGPGTVWMGNGNGTFSNTGQSLGGANSLDAALADLDGDGDLDALVANNGGNRVWLGNGTGNFTAGQSLGSVSSWGVALGHLDTDPWPDAFFANAGIGTSAVGDTVWLHSNATTMVNSGQSLGSQASRKVDLGDLDGDGDLDAVVRSVPGQPNGAWENVGGGSFTAVGQTLGFTGNALDLGDVDGDGFDDAFFAHSGGNRVLTNDGVSNLTFTDSGQSLGSSNSRAIQLGDLDGDGDLDAFVVNLNQPNKVWWNVGNVFCISGTATGTDYAWQITGSGVNVTQLNAPGVTAGSGPAALAQAFVNSINTTAGGTVIASVTAGNSSCFEVSANGSPLLQLSVGPAGSAPGCQVNGAGCTYNPTIREGYPPVASSPGLEIVSPSLFGASASKRFTIEWWASDVSDEATVELYYDTDADGEGGTLIAEGVSAIEGAYSWSVRPVPTGEYYIYAIVSESDHEPVLAVSDGTVTVTER